LPAETRQGRDALIPRRVGHPRCEQLQRVNWCNSSIVDCDLGTVHLEMTRVVPMPENVLWNRRGEERNDIYGNAKHP
jgi:hypothetical protein